MAKDAGALAGEAGARAEAPGSRAAGAFSLAEQGMSRASVNERSLGRMYENLDNCQYRGPGFLGHKVGLMTEIQGD